MMTLEQFLDETHNYAWWVVPGLAARDNRTIEQRVHDAAEEIREDYPGSTDEQIIAALNNERDNYEPPEKGEAWAGGFADNH